MSTPTKEQVAAELSVMAGREIAPDTISDEEMKRFGTPDALPAVAAPIPADPAAPVAPIAAAPVTPPETPALPLAQPQSSPELAQLRAELAELKTKLAASPAAEEPPPPQFAILFDKEVNDPTKNIYGGIALSDEMTVSEGVAYVEAKQNYDRGMFDLHQMREQARRVTQAQQIARDEFRAKHPEVDVHALEREFQGQGLGYEDALKVHEAKAAGGWDKYFEKQAADLASAVNPNRPTTVAAPPAAPKLVVAPPSPPLNNSDGITQPPINIKIPQTIAEYNAMTPEGKRAVQPYVRTLFESNNDAGA